MEIYADVFWAPKAGNSPNEYEDACYPTKSVRLDGKKGFVCAVADGATESSFSGEWARILAEAYCRGSIRESTTNRSLTKLRQKWLSTTERTQLPWYAEQKAASGAFAALVGLTIHRAATRHWNALAIGDCCLFQIRKGSCIAAFPITEPDAFNNGPYLISSNEAHNADLREHLFTQRGEWEPDDAFYLASDAVAEWFLRSSLDGNEPWRVLSDLGTEDERQPFVEFISSLRHAGTLKNDDVTLLRLTCFERLP